MRGTLYIVSASSGTGKSSIVNATLERDQQIALSISFTSRQPRPNERHAQHYYFVSADEFQRMIEAGDFFEYALVHGDWKGTARQSVEPQLAAGHDVLLEIDWQGARQVRSKIPDAISIFILPPSRAALEERLRKRGQDSEEVIHLRLAAAHEEMAHYDEFDYTIINEHFRNCSFRNERYLHGKSVAAPNPKNTACQSDPNLINSIKHVGVFL